MLSFTVHLNSGSTSSDAGFSGAGDASGLACSVEREDNNDADELDAAADAVIFSAALRMAVSDAAWRVISSSRALICSV